VATAVTPGKPDYRTSSLLAQHGLKVYLLPRLPMKHLVGIGVLIAVAFVVRYGLRSSPALDFHIHDAYVVIPLSAVAFWTLVAFAFVWILFFAWALTR